MNNEIIKFFQNINVDEDLARFINPLIYILIAVVSYTILSKIASLIFDRNKKKLIRHQLNRVITLKAMTMSIVKYILFFVVLLAIMANFGIDVSSLLAGLGIAGAILGLAFQDMIKDIIAGFSIIIENQYEVGELIEVGKFKGRVVSVGLKTTCIRDYRGRLKIISNRNISELVNWSRHDTLAEVKVSASYEDDPDKVMEVLEKVKAELDGSYKEMTGPITIFPMTDLGSSAIKYSLRCPCKPYKHFAVQRAMRHEVYKAFKANRIKIPYKQIEIHNNSSK
jgi:small conductance mechanosensitive channel